MDNIHLAVVGEWFNEDYTLEFFSDQNMLEYDFILIETDLFIKKIKGEISFKVKKRIEELHEFIRIKDIPVVFIGFAGGEFGSTFLDRTTVSELFGLETKEVPSKGRKIEINTESVFSGFLKKYCKVLEYSVTYEQHPGISIGKAKSKSASVGFYTRDFIFLPGFAEDEYPDEEAFIIDVYELSCIVRRQDEAMRLPEWTVNYLLPGEQKEREKLEELSKQILVLQQEKEQSELRLGNFLPLKQLWIATGSVLENSVRQVFIELGLEMLPVQERRDDLIMAYGEYIIIGEVKGQNKSAAEKNAAQLEKWVSTYLVNHEDSSPKGLLIVNTYREFPLAERKEHSFPNQMLPYSVARNHCLMTTVQLCAVLLYCRQNPNEKESVLNELFQTIGNYKRFEDWSEHIMITKPQPSKKKQGKVKQVS